MFAQVFRLQGRASALGVALVAVAGFLVPVVAVQRAGFVNPTGWDIAEMLTMVESAGSLFPLLAIVLGLLLAVAAWSPDHRGQHVYALTLPVPRWHYVLLRFAAGVVLLMPVVAAVWIGGVVATGAATIPEGLRVYPGTIALRFGLAALVAYAAVFAVAAGTKRTAAIVFGTLVGVILVQALLELAGLRLEVVRYTLVPLTDWPGPFEVLFGRWMLINV